MGYNNLIKTKGYKSHFNFFANANTENIFCSFLLSCSSTNWKLKTGFKCNCQQVKLLI